MSIGTRAELIKELRKGDPKELLVWTYWGEEDFAEYEDKDQAYQLIEDSLDNCVGQCNEYLESQYTEEEEENE